jgi:hypothetical protein
VEAPYDLRPEGHRDEESGAQKDRALVDGQVCSVPPELLKALVVEFVFGSGPAFGQAA